MKRWSCPRAISVAFTETGPAMSAAVVVLLVLSSSWVEVDHEPQFQHTLSSPLRHV